MKRLSKKKLLTITLVISLSFQASCRNIEKTRPTYNTKVRSSWGQYRRNGSRTNDIPFNIEIPLKLVWHKGIVIPPTARLVCDGKYISTIGYGRGKNDKLVPKIFCFDAQNGSLLWQKTFNPPKPATFHDIAMIHECLLLIYLEQKKYEKAYLENVWQSVGYPYEPLDNPDKILKRGAVSIIAIDARTGKNMWKWSFPLNLCTAMGLFSHISYLSAVSDNKVYLAADRGIFLIDVNHGKTLEFIKDIPLENLGLSGKIRPYFEGPNPECQENGPSPEVPYEWNVFGKRLVAIGQNNLFIAFDIHNLHEPRVGFPTFLLGLNLNTRKWKVLTKVINGKIDYFCYGGKIVCFTTYDYTHINDFFALEEASGEKLWEYNLGKDFIEKSSKSLDYLDFDSSMQSKTSKIYFVQLVKQRNMRTWLYSINLTNGKLDWKRILVNNKVLDIGKFYYSHPINIFAANNLGILVYNDEISSTDSPLSANPSTLLFFKLDTGKIIGKQKTGAIRSLIAANGCIYTIEGHKRGKNIVHELCCYR